MIYLFMHMCRVYLPICWFSCFEWHGQTSFYNKSAHEKKIFLKINKHKVSVRMQIASDGIIHIHALYANAKTNALTERNVYTMNHITCAVSPNAYTTYSKNINVFSQKSNNFRLLSIFDNIIICVFIIFLF